VLSSATDDLRFTDLNSFALLLGTQTFGDYSNGDGAHPSACLRWLFDGNGIHGRLPLPGAEPTSIPPPRQPRRGQNERLRQLIAAELFSQDPN
jgi:hypothetical protein